MTATPYYDRDGITIWHADCRDILPSIDPASVDLLLTDPPYGIDLKFYEIAKTTIRTEPIAGDDVPFDPAHLLAFGRCVLFGANHYAERLPASKGWIVWDKVTRNDVGCVLSDAELAWSNVSNYVRVYRHMWTGAFRDSERGLSVHPTQKPVALMAWILNRWTKPGDLILDPYMGSGPVARAAQLLGRRYIGIELVEDYCRAAVNRLAQPSMFQEAS